MKTIKRMFIFILCGYLIIGLIWIGKDIITHYLNIFTHSALWYII